MFPVKNILSEVCIIKYAYAELTELKYDFINNCSDYLQGLILTPTSYHSISMW